MYVRADITFAVLFYLMCFTYRFDDVFACHCFIALLICVCCSRVVLLVSVGSRMF